MFNMAFVNLKIYLFVISMAGAQGVEPRPHEPESRVLPLDNAPRLGLLRVIIDFGTSKCQVQVLNLKGHL